MSDADETGLSRFGVVSKTIVRSPERDRDEVVVCPECRTPVAASKGSHRIHLPDVVDGDELEETIGRSLITHGWECDNHSYDVVLPALAGGVGAPGLNDGWTSVRIHLADGRERHVPTPESELPDGHDPRDRGGSGRTITDGGIDVDPEREESIASRVGRGGQYGDPEGDRPVPADVAPVPDPDLDPNYWRDVDELADHLERAIGQRLAGLQEELDDVEISEELSLEIEPTEYHVEQLDETHQVVDVRIELVDDGIRDDNPVGTVGAHVVEVAQSLGRLRDHKPVVRTDATVRSTTVSIPLEPGSDGGDPCE